MSSSTRSWRQQCIDADPDFLRESTRYVVYRFSNGREFVTPLDPYGGAYFLGHFTLDQSSLDSPDVL